MNTLAQSLVKAQKAFAPAIKASTNPHFRSKYVDLAGCIEAVIDALNTNGIMLLQPTHLCDDGVTVETIFLHESGEKMSAGVLHVPAAKQDAQGYGSALTYARRYSLMAACGIAPEDDDGNAAARKDAKKVAFDVYAAMNEIEACTTVDQLTLVFKTQGDKAKAAQDRPAYDAMVQAAKDKKAQILGAK